MQKNSLIAYISGIISISIISILLLLAFGLRLTKIDELKSQSQKINELRDSVFLLQTQLIERTRDSTSSKKEKLRKIEYLENYILTKAYTFEQLKIVLDKMSINSPKLRRIPSLFPLKVNTYHTISSAYGVRFHPTKKKYKLHEGLDIASYMNNIVYASADGVVQYKSKSSSYGNMIIIQHAYGFETIYAHLNGFFVKCGDRVQYGQAIALVGNTGISTGPHLHFEVVKNGYKVDPINFIYLTHKKITN